MNANVAGFLAMLVYYVAFLIMKSNTGKDPEGLELAVTGVALGLAVAANLRCADLKAQLKLERGGDGTSTGD